jgi:cbb3-type cytochrome oxidase subunit 1
LVVLYASGRYPGLVVNGQKMLVAGGGSPLLWQHLFWFLIHPEVYVLVLPAMGIVAEIVANNTRKPLYGYRGMVFSVFGIGFLSFIVWAHHMFLTGMGRAVSSFFSLTTVLISVPSVIILERPALIALARFDSVPCVDVVRLRLDADVRHRRLNRYPAGARSG